MHTRPVLQPLPACRACMLDTPHTISIYAHTLSAHASVHAVLAEAEARQCRACQQLEQHAQAPI
jgi:hypothetical protein